MDLYDLSEEEYHPKIKIEFFAGDPHLKFVFMQQMAKVLLDSLNDTRVQLAAWA